MRLKQTTREDLKERASEEGVDLTGDEKPKGFYAFFVWNYDEECVQVFQFSQQGLIDPIISNLSDEEISRSLTLTTSSWAPTVSLGWISATRWLVSPASVAKRR